MPKPPPWHYDPNTQAAPLLAAMAELRLVCCKSRYTVPFMKERGSFECIEAIKKAIDDFAENELGTREFLLGQAAEGWLIHRGSVLER